MLLSKRLKELRISSGLTQKELGERVNVTKVSICCYESGTRVPTIDTLTKLSEIFNVDTDYLLGYDIPVKIRRRKKKIINMTQEEIIFIKKLRENEYLHQKMLDNPKEFANLIEKKFNK